MTRLVQILLAATLGVISPAGNEVGPFLAIEQAALSQAVPGDRRTHVFAWYALAGSFATALGSLSGGALASALRRSGAGELASYRAVALGYAALGAVLVLLFTRVGPAAEAPAAQRAADRPGPVAGWLGLHRSRTTVLRLSALFSVDAFAGGFVVQSFVAYWFHRKFGADPAVLGAIFFGANLIAGLSVMLIARVVASEPLPLDKDGFFETWLWRALAVNIALVALELFAIHQTEDAARAAKWATTGERLVTLVWGVLLAGHVLPLTLLYLDNDTARAAAALLALIGLAAYEHLYVRAGQSVALS